MKNKSVVIKLICPKCGKEIGFEETNDNNYHCLDENHQPDNNAKGYCMSFNKTPYGEIFKLMGNLIKHKLPTIFSQIDRTNNDEDTLNAALNAIKKGTIGIDLKILDRNQSIIGTMYAWKRRDNYYGVMDGVITTENFIATAEFEGINKFISNWYFWGKK